MLFTKKRVCECRSAVCKIRVNRPIMKLDGKNIICVYMLVFYDTLIFK